MKQQHLSFFLVLCLLSASATVGAGVQPVQRTAAGHLVTEVTLQGSERVLFNVDTGAGATAVYEHARKRMRLARVPGARIEMQGAAGTQEIERYRLPLLSVAGVEARNLLVSGLPAGISHGDEVMGILGRDVLSKHVVEFDLVQDRLGLHAPGTRPSSVHGWHRIPFRLRPDIGLIELTVELGGAKVRSVLDTGARKSFVNWHAARAAGISPQSPGLVRSSASGGATAHAFSFDIASFPDVEIGGARLRRPLLSIADLPAFAALHMDNRPAMIVGLDLIGDRRFVVDYPNSQLMIERLPAAPASTKRPR